MAFQTSDSNAATDLRPVRIAALAAGVFDEARTLAAELPGWSVLEADAARGRIDCKKQNGLLGGTARITILVESPAVVSR